MASASTSPSSTPNADVKIPIHDTDIDDTYKLHWDNLRYSVPQKGKEDLLILDRLYGHIKAGEVGQGVAYHRHTLFHPTIHEPESTTKDYKGWVCTIWFTPTNACFVVLAVMGGSGAGKTTLLNALAGRVSGGDLTGTILLDGRKRIKKLWKKQVGYVEQVDLMYEMSTVKETFQISANLRLPDSSYTQAQKDDIVMSTINDLGLSHRTHSQVNTLSGGERKRCAVGIELCAKPSLIFLDEPTTGLDSFNALLLCQLLQRMAKERNHAIIMTIHMPRENIIELFDNLILMSKGNMAWFGPVKAAVEHLQNVGFNIPGNMNPADHMLDLATIDHRSDELHTASIARADKLINAYNQDQKAIYFHPHTATNTAPLEIGTLRANTPAWYVIAVLWRRNFYEIFRNKGIVIGTLMQNFVMFLLIGFIFFRLDDSPAHTQSRIGVLFALCINTIFPNLMPIVSVLPAQRGLYRRERAAGLYGNTAAFIARASTQIILPLIGGLVLALPVYWLVNLWADFVKYVIFVIVIELVVGCAVSQGMWIGAVAPNVQLALIIAPVTQVIFLFFGGLLANTDSIPKVLSWIRYISPVYYAYSALMQNEFVGRSLQCPGGVCAYPSGDYVVSFYSVDRISILGACFTIFGFSCCYMIAGLIALRHTAKPQMMII